MFAMTMMDCHVTMHNVWINVWYHHGVMEVHIPAMNYELPMRTTYRTMRISS